MSPAPLWVHRPFQVMLRHEDTGQGPGDTAASLFGQTAKGVRCAGCAPAGWAMHMLGGPAGPRPQAVEAPPLPFAARAALDAVPFLSAANTLTLEHLMVIINEVLILV